MQNKKGQVWIETVIYTLIALAMIGAVLSFAKPKIEQMQDKAIIEDTVKVLEEMNTIILDVRKVSGNQRVVELGIKKGSFEINATNDRIFFEIESRYKYSQPGEVIKSGSVDILTEEITPKKSYKIYLTLNYPNYDLQLKGLPSDAKKQITKASSLYKIKIVNEGKEDISEKTILEFEID